MAYNPFEQSEIAVEELTSEESQLIIYNDEVNTFEHVINSLIEVCKHETLQAEQCTIIIHYKGKCAVKTGTFDTLEPMCVALHDRGLSAEIE